jgi:hypothetical protein
MVSSLRTVIGNLNLIQNLIFEVGETPSRLFQVLPSDATSASKGKLFKTILRGNLFDNKQRLLIRALLEMIRC